MEVKKPEIDINIEVEVLEDRIAPGVGGSIMFSIGTPAGLRSLRADHHAAAGLRRAGSASDALVFGKGDLPVPPPIIIKGR